MNKLAWLLLFVAQPAWAWVQYRTLPPDDNGALQGCGIRWPVTTVPLALDATVLDGLANVDVQAIAAASGQTWQDVQCGLCAGCVNGLSTPQTCALNPLGQQFQWLPRGTPTPIGAQCIGTASDGSCASVAGNGNWVNFVHDAQTWQAQGVSNLVVALTVLTYDRNSGAVRDADVLLDDWGHDFCVAPNCAAGAYDLQSTLTHEFGHVLGLDHSLDPEATMYAGADPGETKKRTLAADDTAGICTTYRTTCSACNDPPKASGCAAGRIASGWPLLLLLAAWATIRRSRN